MVGVFWPVSLVLFKVYLINSVDYWEAPPRSNMAHYVSVRGWIECDTAFLPRVKQLIKDFATRPGNGKVTSEQARLYSQGWIVSENAPNWTKYCFYGADIRLDALDFLRAQVQEIAEVLVSDDQDNPLGPDKSWMGIFYIDDDEGEISLMWYIKEGSITEKVRDPWPGVKSSTKSRWAV